MEGRAQVDGVGGGGGFQPDARRPRLSGDEQLPVRGARQDVCVCVQIRLRAHTWGCTAASLCLLTGSGSEGEGSRSFVSKTIIQWHL